MKCPDCGGKLIKIGYTDGEYFCPNDDCPANIKRKKMGLSAHAEYYGDNQFEINKQKG